MQLSYYAARANLYYLSQQHPEWEQGQFAAALGSSKEWVKKWLKRLREELAQGKLLEEILQGHSQARKQPPEQTHPVVVAQILAIRDHPPEGLRRVPGQEAIHYYLERDQMLQYLKLPVPSCKTIYRILKANDRIASKDVPIHKPMERPAPMTCWQIDWHRMLAAFQQILMARSNMWWKRSTSLTLAPRSCLMLMSAPILQQKRLWKPSP